VWLGEIQVPVCVAFGTLDLMLGVFAAGFFFRVKQTSVLRACSSP
jgi:hypothetical protein